MNAAILDIIARLNTSQASPQAKDLAKDLGAVDKAAVAGNTSVSGLSKVMQFGLAAGAGIAVAGVGLLTKGLFDSVEAAAEAEQVQAQLEAVIKSTGGAAGLTADEINKMASGLAEVTTFGDDAIVSAQSLLLTFTNIGADVFPRATETMLDLATAMGTDASGGAIQLGKALNDPITGISALTRVGVTFTDEQKEMIRSMVEMGDVAGAQTIILDELAKEFGGSAAAAADTFSGRMTQLRDRIGEAQEEIGKAFLPALTTLAETAIPAVQDAAEDLAPIVQAIANENLPKLVEGVTKFLQEAPKWVNALDEVYDAAKTVYDILTIMPQSAQAVGEGLHGVAIGAADLYEVTEGHDGVLRELIDNLRDLYRETHQVTVAAYGYIPATSQAVRVTEENADAVEEGDSAYRSLMDTIDANRISMVSWITTASNAERVSLLQAQALSDHTAPGYEAVMAAVRGSRVNLDEWVDSAEAAETAALDLSAAEAELATQTGAYFDQALTATGETESLEMMLYNASAAAGLYAGDLAIAAGNTGEFSEAQIDLAFETANAKANIDLLVASVQGGTISMGEATTALDLLKDGEVDMAAEAISLVQNLDEVQAGFDDITGAAIDAAAQLTAFPSTVTVDFIYNAPNLPDLPGGYAGPGSTGGGQGAGQGGGGSGGNWATGGYTGYGPVNEIAGYVHRQEYVLNAAAVNRVGLSNLEAINSGRTAGMGGDTYNIYVDARGSSDPAAVEAAGYRGAQRGLAETGRRADYQRRTR